MPSTQVQLAPAIPLAPGAGPIGVGGWLTFFCVGLTILGPLMFAGQVSSNWEESKQHFSRIPELKTVLLIELIGLGALKAYGFVIGIVIWSGDKRGRFFARQFLIVASVGYLCVELIALSYGGHALGMAFTQAAGPPFIAGLIGQAIILTLWWLYFAKSRRVRNTYGA